MNKGAVVPSDWCTAPLETNIKWQKKRIAAERNTELSFVVMFLVLQKFYCH